MPFRPEPLDIVIILLVAILLFGPSRLPEIGRGVGKAITEFRKGLRGTGEVPTARLVSPPAETLWTPRRSPSRQAVTIMPTVRRIYSARCALLQQVR